MAGGGKGGGDPIVFFLYFFIWAEIRLQTKFQLPVLFRNAVVGLNPIQGGVGWWGG